MSPGDIVTVYSFPLRGIPGLPRGPELYRARLNVFIEEFSGSATAMGSGLFEHWIIERLDPPRCYKPPHQPVWIAVKIIVRGRTVPEFGYYKPYRFFLSGWPYTLEVNESR